MCVCVCVCVCACVCVCVCGVCVCVCVFLLASLARHTSNFNRARNEGCTIGSTCMSGE